MIGNFTGRLKTALTGTSDAELVFLGNFEVEDQWARGETGLPRLGFGSGNVIVNRMDEFALLLAGKGDHVVLKGEPDADYLSHLEELGLDLPRMLVVERQDPRTTVTQDALEDPPVLRELGRLGARGGVVCAHGVSELEERLAELDRQGKLLEAQRLRMRTTYDLEMMRQVGFCNGIENYSMHIDGRTYGDPPHCLIDYFPDDFLTVIDESHQTIPQIGAMYEGDASRKRLLVEHGFRLPSAADNRPLRFDEFLERVGQMVFLSATPGSWELQHAGGEFVEQVIRPTGLVDPEVIIKPTKGQIDDLMYEIQLRAERDERVLVTTLTKKMSEDLTDYLLEHGIRVRYLHSEVDTLRRVELLRELRKGDYDVLVGINLLREGLDLPEVSLVAILDADKEGFLRSGTSLVQTIGRAARNVSGQVHMYADKITPSMATAIDETNRRRAKQVAHNEANGISPEPLRKKIHDILDDIYREADDTEGVVGGSGRQMTRGKAPVPQTRSRGKAATPSREGMARADLAQLIQDLNDQMLAAARELQFELAARIRDEVRELKKELRGMDVAGVK